MERNRKNIGHFRVVWKSKAVEASQKKYMDEADLNEMV